MGSNATCTRDKGLTLHGQSSILRRAAKYLPVNVVSILIEKKYLIVFLYEVTNNSFRSALNTLEVFHKKVIGVRE